MFSFVVRLLVTAAALAVAAFLIPGIHLEGWVSYLIVALIFGFVNAVIRPIALLVTCLLNIFTLGLFVLVVNAVMFLLTAWLANTIAGATGLDVSFRVDDFWSAFLGAIIVSIVSFILSRFFGTDEE